MKQPPWLLMVLSIMAGLGIIQMTWLLGRTVYDTLHMQQKNVILLQKVQDKRLAVNELKAMNTYLNDPEFLEAAARCKGYIRKGETLYRDPKKPSKNLGQEGCRSLLP